MNILVVEDERNLANAIVRILCDDGHKAEAEFDGTAGLSRALDNHHDAVVLDVMLPGMDGYEVVRQMRSAGVMTPVLMLTARSTTADKVDGLDAGADDYMTKPFEAEELLARLRALGRRRGDIKGDELVFDDIMVSLTDHDLHCGKRRVHLSSKEFEVMNVLMAVPGQVVSKEELLDRVWGTDVEASKNSVEAYVSFLRKKLAHVGSRVQIATLRMLGYRLETTEV